MHECMKQINIKQMEKKVLFNSILYRRGLLLSVSDPSRPAAATGSQPCVPLLPVQWLDETQSSAGQHAT